MQLIVDVTGSMVAVMSLTQVRVVGRVIRMLPVDGIGFLGVSWNTMVESEFTVVGSNIILQDVKDAAVSWTPIPLAYALSFPMKPTKTPV